MADATNCNGFYVCTNGNKFKKTCPGVLRWSTIKNKCEWPNSVQCGSRPVTASATAGGAKTCNCPSGKSECFYEGKVLLNEEAFFFNMWSFSAAFNDENSFLHLAFLLSLFSFCRQIIMQQVLSVFKWNSICKNMFRWFGMEHSKE